MAKPTEQIARLGEYNTSFADVPHTMVGPDGYGYVEELPRLGGDMADVANWLAGEVVDIATDGVRWIPDVIRVRSVGDVSLATGLENGDTLNGVVLIAGDNVFLALQANPAENGIYTVSPSGVAARASFANTAAELALIAFVIQSGSVGAGERWCLPLREEDITVDATALRFSQLALSGATAAQGAKADSAVQPDTRFHSRSQVIRGDGISDILWADRVGDFEAGERGPMFVWNNPTPVEIVAGKNAGIQIWVGDNPTPTPGAQDPVGLTIAVVNGNSRERLYGQNIIAGNGDHGAGWLDGLVCGLEINLYSGFALTQANPFGAGARKNGLEIVGNGGAGGRLTAAMMVWTNDSAGNTWWTEGVALSRIIETGLHFYKDPNGGSDATAAFQTAAIFDASDSTAVLKVAGSHASIVDLSSTSSVTNFVKGKSGADTSLVFANGVDFGTDIRIDSGATVGKISSLTLADRGVAKWTVSKTASGNFRLQNEGTAKASFSINAATDSITAIANLYVGSGAGNPLGLGTALSINAASGSSGIDLQTAGLSRLYLSTDGGSYGQLMTSGSIDLLLGAGGAERLRILNNPGNGLGIKAPVPANSYANDAAAASAGVAIGALYRNGSAIQQRIS